MATNNVTCSACLNIIKHKQYLVCSTCSQKYDIGCLNITEKRFLSLDTEKKNNWLCVKCKSKQPKKDNSNTPIRGTLQDNQSSLSQNSDCQNQNITKRKKASKTDVSPSTSTCGNELITDDVSYGSLLSTLTHEIHVAVNEAVNKTVESYFAKQFESLKEELSTLKDLKSSIEFLSADYDRVKTDLQICNEKLMSLTKENTKLTESVKDLNSRLSMLEQYSRERNIEINGIPEGKEENLFTVVKQLCTTVSVPIMDNDIVTCVRIRKMNPQSKIPRPVVVKLQSTKLRDEIIAGLSKFNRRDRENKLNTSHLGYGCSKQPIYVSEHLTPYLKSLHAQTRLLAREKKYKYVWIRNGRILVRKDDNSPAIPIKNLDSLKLIE
ncbi:PREDICTED: uncharacterized protein LOC106127791 [Papilio xuthus]|uniref:Uncharacterized protein LOC106127791 n=1 Tax=Papilio xuthus TaxID=66420 RepID=A0AAJ7EL20_PAPXU|nr:PREDICTED: uncharacterized protein LOC106127791 [Papilio xuthus]